MHANKIIHRDIKPMNILIRKHNPLQLCLADFGESIDLSSEENFQAKLYVGTPGYLPPEMKNAENSAEINYSFSIDVYSAAVLAKRACTFLKPIEAIQKTLPKLRSDSNSESDSYDDSDKR